LGYEDELLISITKIIGIIGVFLLAPLLVTVSTASSPDWSRADDVKKTLASTDYLPAILSMKQEESVGNLEMLHWSFYRKYDPAEKERSYTEAELRFFSVFRSNIDYPFSFQTTISNVLAFYRDNARIPQDGLELIEYVSGENTFNPEKSRLIALGPDREVEVYLKVFPTVFSAVNPASGKFIDSFSQSEWTPLGINITEIDEVPREYYEVDDSGNLRLPDGFVALRVQLYGEVENRIIYDHIVSEYRVN
jgi:hypothetical protein